MTRAQLVDQVLKRVNEDSARVHEAIDKAMWDYDVADQARKQGGLPAFTYETGMVLWLERQIKRRLHERSPKG